MPPSSKSTYHLAIAQAQIDEEIVRHKLAIHDLCTRRNSLSLISDHLPDEVLAYIFIYCACDHPYNAWPITTHQWVDVNNWVTVSHVCSHWRNVALSFPALWSYIRVPTASQCWTELLLARSKQAPLKIHIEVNHQNDAWWMKLTEMLMHHGERIEGLCFSVKQNRMADWCLSGLASSVTNLKHFEFSMQEVDYPPHERVPFATQILWGVCKLGSLTTLNLHSIPSFLKQDTGKFLGMLSGMRNIVDLRLDGALASATDLLSSAELDNLEKINLPSLSRFLVTAPISTVIVLLSCMNIPATTEKKLVCDSGQDPDDNYITQLLSILAQFSFPTIRSVVINLGDDPAFVFSTSLTGKCDPSPCIPSNVWGGGISLEIQLILNGYLRERQIVDEMLSSVPVTNVRSLCVHWPPSFQDFWEQTLGHLPELQHIKLHVGDMPDLAPVLSLTKAPESVDLENLSEDAGDADVGRVFAPALEDLELDDIWFDKPDELQSLYDALSTRNASPGRLTMANCSLRLDSFESYDTMVGTWKVVSKHW